MLALNHSVSSMLTTRCLLLVLSLLGSLLFGAAFFISYLDPLLVERGAREVIRIEVEHRVGERIDTLSDSRLVKLAQRAVGATEQDIEASRKALRDKVPSRVANVVANMLKADCECRKRLVEFMKEAENERLSSLVQLREKLTGFAESAYGKVTSSLMREFRIFTSANASAFALLGAVTFFRRRAALQLLLPAVVLVGAMLFTGGLYLFEQNWLHTILFSSYVGFAYLGYLGLVAALLADVVFNRARVTTRLLNFFANLLGAAISAVPC